MSRVFDQSTSNTLTASVSVAANRSAYSIMAWVKPNASFTGTTQQFISFDNFFNKPNLRLHSADLDPCEFRVASADPGDDGSPEVQTETLAVTKGSWRPCIIIATGSQIEVHTVGANNTNVSATETISTAVTTLRIGSGASLDAYGGKVAHVAAWKRALNSTEIADLLGGANPGSISSANRWFYYPLTDASLTNIWTPTDGDTAGTLSVNGTVNSDTGDNPSVSGGGGGGGDTLVVVGNPQRNRRTSGRRM